MEDFRSKSRRLWYKIKYKWGKSIFWYVFGIITWIVAAALGSLIDSRFPEIYDTTLAPWLSETAPVPRWLLLTSPILLSLTLFVVWKLSKNKSSSSTISPSAILKEPRAFEHTQVIIKLFNDIDADLQPYFAEAKEKDFSNLEAAVESILTHTFEFFDRTNTRTAVIFRAKVKSTPDFLAAWHANAGHYLTEKTFYIGNDEQRQKEDGGVAGKVYREGKIRIRKIVNKKTGVSDHPDNRWFEAYEKAIGGTDYGESLVAPIRWNNKTIAVLAIDAQKNNFFTKEYKEIVQLVADKIGTILFYYNELEWNI